MLMTGYLNSADYDREICHEGLVFEARLKNMKKSNEISNNINKNHRFFINSVVLLYDVTKKSWWGSQFSVTNFSYALKTHLF